MLALAGAPVWLMKDELCVWMMVKNSTTSMLGGMVEPSSLTVSMSWLVPLTTR